MYVYQNKDLPPDPDFPVDLKELGYYINEHDQIRQIDHPEEGYRYKINRNDRFNVRFRESLNDCIRAIILDRLKDVCLTSLRLPLDSTLENSHVPILTTKNLDEKSRIIIVFGEPIQDLGVWAYRSIHDSINRGSAVDFTNAVLGGGKNKNVGLLIANTGQLIWHCASERAVSQQSWLASPRPYGNWGQATMSWRNKIPSNNDWQQHIEYIFEKVLWPAVGKQTRIDIIGMSEGGLGAIRYLQKNWNVWKPYVSGICLGDPQQTTHTDIDMGALTDPSSFTSFFASRCRAYLLSSTPCGSRMGGYRMYGCNCYSSGEGINTECIMPASWKDMLEWLDVLSTDPTYSEHVMLRGEDMDEEMRRGLEEQAENEGDSRLADIDEQVKPAEIEWDSGSSDIKKQQELETVVEDDSGRADLAAQKELQASAKSDKAEDVEKDDLVAKIVSKCKDLKVTDSAI